MQYEDGVWRECKRTTSNRRFFFLRQAFILSRHLRDIGSQVDTRVPYSCFAKHIHNCFTIRKNMDWEFITPPDGYLCHQYRYRAARFAQHYFENRRHAEAGTMLEPTNEYEMTLQGSGWPSDKGSLDLYHECEDHLSNSGGPAHPCGAASATAEG
jgi:hypothetical protein